MKLMQQKSHMIVSKCFFILAVLTPLIATDGGTKDMTRFYYMTAIKDSIFGDYDKLIRPINDTGISTHIKLRIFPKYIVDVDDEKSLFKLDSYFSLHWLDPRLTWSNESNIQWIQMPVDMIWKPDITLWNSHVAKVDPYEAVTVNIRNNGEVWWFPPATTATFCVVAEVDEVTCELEIGSWIHYGEELNLETFGRGGIFLSQFDNVNPSWKLKEDKVTVTRHVHNFSDEIFVSLLASFPMERRPAPQLHMVRAPCIMGSVLMLALLCVPPQQCYARVLFGAFLFLVLIVLMLYASATAKTMQTAKNAVALVRSTAIVLTIFLAMQVVTLRLSSCCGPSRPNAALVRWLTTPVVERVLFWKQDITADGILPKVGDEISSPSARDEWTLVAAALDRILFVICVPTMAFILIVD